MPNLPELLVQKDLFYQLVLCVAVPKTPVRIRLESVPEMKWNHRPESNGIGVRFALEYAGMIRRYVLNWGKLKG
jgi:hypothetical protein